MKTFIRDVVDRGNDRRADPRYSISGSLPGELKSDDGHEYNVMPVDISRRGMGILIEPAPKPGAVISLEVLEDEPGKDNQILHFTIRHVLDNSMRSVSGLVDMKRCGIEIVDPDRSLDLIHFFAQYDTLIIQE